MCTCGREQPGECCVAIAHAAVGILRCDLEGRVCLANPAIHSMLGYSQGELLGRDCRELIWPEDQGLDGVLAAELREGTRPAYTIERRFRHKDGHPICVELSVSAIADPQGHVSGVVHVLTDISELVAARYAAEEASRAKDHFLAVLSHELRTPLAPVLTTVQMLEAQNDLSQDLRESLGLIRRNVEMEARLIDDLLDVTRISRGKLELHITATCIHDTIRNVVATCHGELASKAQHLALDFAATRHCVHGDPGRIQQVFWNLVRNASKFTPPDGSLTVSTRDAADGGLLIHVVDTGMGIEPEHLPHIFDAFEQGDRSVTRAFGGLGLGLSISRGLMELHGGRLTASSAGRGQGSTFTAGFPAAITFAAVSVPNGPDLPLHHNEARCEILLVEDHADTAHALARVLKTHGHRVRIAQSVAAALAAAAEPFDLLICDIGLPDGSGLDLMVQLRGMRPVRAIALSGFGMDEDLRKSEEAGFLAHLTKPVDLAQLEAAINRLIVSPVAV